MNGYELNFISLTLKYGYNGEWGLEERKVTIRDFFDRKKQGKKFVMISVCDYPMALLANKAGIDAILVGDALHMVALGHDTTTTATVDEMIMFSNAISRAAKRAFIIGDMPFMSHEPSKELAIKNAGRFLSEGLCDAVKLEGGEEIADTVRTLVKAGIPIMGHIGLTPQKVSMLGGFRAQGLDADSAEKILNDALALQEAGAFMIMLEATAAEAAKIVTEKISIPTVGIGGGVNCDGQCMVSHDLLGLYDRTPGKHAKNFVKLHETILKTFQTYRDEVLSSKWPDPEHIFTMKEGELSKFQSKTK